MKHGRLISKRIAYSKKLKCISPYARAIYLAAIPHRDDLGRLDGDPETFQSIVCPMWPEDVGEVAVALDDIHRVNLCERYSANGQLIIQFTRDEDFSLWRKDLLRRADYPNKRGKCETLEWDTDAKKWRIRDES